MKNKLGGMLIKFPESLVIAVLFLLFSTGASAQTVVTGRVTDSKDGTPVAGVTVSTKTGKVATQTNSEGAYSIKVPAGVSALVFTSVGYARQEVPVASVVDISFTAINQQLNEVVVLGYGGAKKKDLSGAVTTISAKDFQKGVVTSPEQLILGKVAGVSITPGSGAPGSGGAIRIRGGASLRGSNDPLIIIDGVQIAGGGIAGSANPLSLINPNDIETFTVLKDASAAAIYGSRGSNGVIIITTKKGRGGAAKVNFNTQLSIGRISKKIDVLSADEFRTFVNTYGNDAQKALLGNANTDWQDEIYRTAITTDNNISITGTATGEQNFRLPYRVSLGYLNQNGVLKVGNLERYSVGLNLSPRLLNDHLRVNLNGKFARNKSLFGNEGAIGTAVRFDPTQPVRTNSNRYGGYYEWLDQGSQSGLKALAPRNPIGLMQRDDRSTVDRFIGNVELDYKLHFFPDLRANLNVGIDQSAGNGRVYVSDSMASDYMRANDENNVLRSGRNNYYQQKFDNRFFEFYLAYGKDIRALNSRVDLTAGYGFYDNLYLNTNTADYFANGMKRANSDPAFFIDLPQNRLESYYGRLNYVLSQKYIFTVNLRYDGSSRLNPNDRWLLYHSEAFAWKIKEEAFLRDSRVISDLKLRVGYGITAQQDGIGNYSYLPNYQFSSPTATYQFGNEFMNMYRPLGYNSKLTWEKTATTNIAVDFGLFDGRINGSVDFYHRETTDLLNDLTQPAGNNFAAVQLSNVGTMVNKGVEITLNTVPVRKSDLVLDLGFNATYNRNRITKLSFNDDPNYEGQLTGGISGGTGGTIQVNSVGFPRQAFYVFQQVYDANGKPIDNLFEDRNRDGVINDRDKYRYQSPFADWFLGFNGNLNYKKWSAGFIMRASIGNYMYNNVYSSTGTVRNILDPLGYLANGSKNVLETGFSGNGDYYFRSDYYVQNASFLRMDNINIGYNFGQVISRKASLRATATIQNAFVITKYKGADPEIFNGIDNNFYPRPRTVVFGLNLDF
ncbi:MAG TPA: SusC/RagA family TonB-linked outer membrane protein [Ferruginibacter sp.]|nr:SusC/RagA family TonB-linked outer membrane protein [Ferruginibacter sp.]HMP20668.1 SusC/RagA family TonB-linked outer membrane protein [Ferruginibacter sp.]